MRVRKYFLNMYLKEPFVPNASQLTYFISNSTNFPHDNRREFQVQHSAIKHKVDMIIIIIIIT